LLAFESPLIEKLVFLKSARVGYAVFINTTTGWLIANDPGNVLVVQNTESDAEKFSTGEVGKVISHCAPVMDRVIKGAKQSLLEKTFLGGKLLIGYATSPSTFRMVTIRYFYGDEISGWPDNIENEGDGVDLGIVRTETEDNRVIVLGSTPKMQGTCKITREFLLTDQRYLYIPCPHCQHMQRLKLANLRYDPKDFSTAHFACESCGGAIRESDKYQFLQQAQWRATRKFTCCGEQQTPSQWDTLGSALCQHCGKPGDTNERGKLEAGFHIWTAYNDNANTSIPAIARQYHDAREDPDTKMQRFMNTVVGVAHTQGQRHFALTGFDKLYKRREALNLHPLPDSVVAIVGSADTQKDRFEYHLYAVIDTKRLIALDYGAIHGDPEEPRTQQRLITVFDREFTLHNGRRIRPFAAVLDCNGNYWESMLTFCRDYPNFLYAIRGQADKRARLSTDTTLSRNTHREVGCEFRSINVHYLKNKAAGLLNSTHRTREYLHFPDTEVFNLTYFTMLTAEELKGIGAEAKWQKKKGQTRNEPWDLLVYALWLIHFYRVDIADATPSAPLGVVNDTPASADSDSLHYPDHYHVQDVY
jgi:phage terminase large subunit GpA-like protein